MASEHTLRMCAAYNASRTRDDTVWIVTPSGDLVLTDRPEWTAKRTKELAEAAERDRQQFNHRQRYPIQEAAE